jgi:hypothetical protein
MESAPGIVYDPKIPTHVIINHQFQNAAQAVTRTVFEAPSASESLNYGAYRVVAVSVSLGQVSDVTGAVDVVQAVDATAIGSGTTVLSAAVNTNTIVAATKTAATVLTNAAANITPGSRLGIKWSGTVTNVLDACVTVVLERI